MAKLESGASADLLTIDPVSKAARFTLYNPDGTLTERTNVGKYFARVEILPTTLVTGTTYWSIRNNSAKNYGIDRFFVSGSFIGVAAASRSIFEMERFNTATPAGGTLVANEQYGSTIAPSLADVRYAPAGLTTAGVVFNPHAHQYGVTNQLSFQTILDMMLGEKDDEQLVLLPGEGLCIRANSAIVAGAGLLGSVHWHEWNQ